MANHAPAEGDARKAPQASDADVAERLLLEFGPTHGLLLISEIIRSCRTEMRNAGPAAQARSLDVLARERLARL